MSVSALLGLGEDEMILKYIEEYDWRNELQNLKHNMSKYTVADKELEFDQRNDDTALLSSPESFQRCYPMRADEMKAWLE